MKQVKKSKRPVVLTVNGKAAALIQASARGWKMHKRRCGQ